MATRTIVQRFSDVSGEALDASVKTTAFSIDGADYEIDLSNAELTELHRSLSVYVKAARQLTEQGNTARPRPGKPDLDKIREWAESNGHQVASRGRISQSVLDAYDRAHS